MKLFAVVTATAVICTSLVAASSAEANRLEAIKNSKWHLVHGDAKDKLWLSLYTPCYDYGEKGTPEEKQFFQYSLVCEFIFKKSSGYFSVYENCDNGNRRRSNGKKDTGWIKRDSQQSSYQTYADGMCKRFKASQNDFHNKCKDAKDYQGCLNSFAGNTVRNSSSTGMSEYERRQIQMQEKRLEQEREYALQQRKAEQRRQDRARRAAAADMFMRGMNQIGDSFMPSPSINCTTTPDYLGGSSTTCY